MQLFGDVFDSTPDGRSTVTPMTNAARCSYNTRLAGWMSALVATATFAFLQSAYERLPIVVRSASRPAVP